MDNKNIKAAWNRYFSISVTVSQYFRLRIPFVGAILRTVSHLTSIFLSIYSFWRRKKSVRFSKQTCLDNCRANMGAETCRQTTMELIHQNPKLCNHNNAKAKLEIDQLELCSCKISIHVIGIDRIANYNQLNWLELHELKAKSSISWWSKQYCFDVRLRLY